MGFCPVENGDGAVKGGAAYTNWRGWALPQPNVIRIIGATVGTTSFLAVVSRRSQAAFITAYTRSAAYRSDTASCSAFLVRAAAWIIDAIGRANLCCRALGYLGGEGCIFRERLTRSLERDLDKHD
jgi:hypothetical protein